jgi:glutaredoxin
MTKDFFAKNGVQYDEKNVATDLDARKEMVDKSHQLGVPVIDVGGDIVIGFDQKNLETLLHIGK